MFKHKFTLSLGFFASASLVGLFAAPSAVADPDPLLGDIMPVAFNFCPRGWANADGQLLAINSNQSLYSLYGTMYGGDGRTTFALPDLRSRTPIHNGSTGGSIFAQGARSGTEWTFMSSVNMPNHTHRAGIKTLSGKPNTNTPLGASFSVRDENAYREGNDPSQRYMNLSTVAVENIGGGQAQNNMQPYLVIRYCVATTGTFPSRN